MVYVFRSLNRFIGTGIGTSTFYGATKKSKQYLQICDIAFDSLLSDADSDLDNNISLADPDFVPGHEESECK